MLKLLFPLLLLLSIKPKWNQTVMFLALMMSVNSLQIMANQMPINKSEMWGFDYMSASLIIMTMWIMPMILIASQDIFFQKKATKEFIFLNISLTLILIMSFSTSHMFLFYIMFEASLIPTLLIIMKWGYQPERLQAGMYLMMYTITASLPLLVGIAYLTTCTHLYNMFVIMGPSMKTTYLMWITMNLAFMVKLPLFLFHLWLPKAHVEAPIAGSMILAAVLLKLGGYGMLRVIYLSPQIPSNMKIYLLMLALWGGMVTSLICVRQQDIKALIAYSSVGHMSLVMAGILSNITWGIWGALAMMISHGLLSSTLFASADISYKASGSRSLLMNKGTNLNAPSMSMLWFTMSAANMAAPPSSNLMAEIMLISCSIFSSKMMMLPLTVMSFTSAAYSLMLYVSMNHGPMSPSNSHMSITTSSNLLIITSHMAPLVIIMLMPSLITLW